MKRTGAGVIVVCTVFGAVLGALVDFLLVTRGAPMLFPALTLPFSLVMLAIIILALAIPIYRAVRATPRRRVDSFHALRVLMLGKAAAVTGALIAGFGFGLLGFTLSRSVMPGVDSWASVIAACVGGILLAIAGLITEFLCTLPKDTDDDLPGAAAAS